MPDATPHLSQPTTSVHTNTLTNTMSGSKTNGKMDPIQRGSSTPAPGGRAFFVLLRSLDPFLQYGILAHGLGTSVLHRLGLRTVPAVGLASNTGIAAIDGLHLSPYRLILLGMAVGSTLKHNYWATQLSNEPITPGIATMVGVFNAVMNCVCSYAFLVRAASTTHSSEFPQPALMIGSTLYVIGTLVELISEIQRKRFKENPNNKGKPYTGGLWKLARHINYFGYTLWRTGYAVAGGGYTLGAVVGAFFLFDFATRGVPVLNEYCEKRYGADWAKFKQDTPYRLIPFLY